MKGEGGSDVPALERGGKKDFSILSPPQPRFDGLKRESGELELCRVGCGSVFYVVFDCRGAEVEFGLEGWSQEGGFFLGRSSNDVLFVHSRAVCTPSVFHYPYNFPRSVRMLLELVTVLIFWSATSFSKIQVFLVRARLQKKKKVLSSMRPFFRITLRLEEIHKSRVVSSGYTGDSN